MWKVIVEETCREKVGDVVEQQREDGGVGKGRKRKWDDCNDQRTLNESGGKKPRNAGNADERSKDGVQGSDEVEQDVEEETGEDGDGDAAEGNDKREEDNKDLASVDSWPKGECQMACCERTSRKRKRADSGNESSGGTRSRKRMDDGSEGDSGGRTTFAIVLRGGLMELTPELLTCQFIS